MCLESIKYFFHFGRRDRYVKFRLRARMRRIIPAAMKVHPMELYRISRDNPAKLPGWRRYVYPIYTTYNGKSRKDALPMKF